jgi:hypothetical protein
LRGGRAGRALPAFDAVADGFIGLKLLDDACSRDPDASPPSTCRVDPLAAVTVARLGPTKAQAVAAWVSAPALLDGGGAALDDGAGSVVVAAAGHR